ncbi:MAG: PH domain-containing protein [Gammaproteobacteria bacterium]|nr:PH domain-containing protein [Gammaproteobacteria bacterium]
MKLDSGENLELDVKPDEKILVVWFLTKTLGYSFAVMFFVFMILFLINSISVAPGREGNPQIDVAEELSISNETEDTGKEKKEIEHPFKIIVDYWGWALLLVGAASIFIQVYLFFLRKTYRYIITDRRCIFVGGILKRVERSVPHKKITDIQRSQNIIERLLGIWNVQVFTPGTASVQIGHTKARAELNFDGLIVSEEVYESISRHTQLND